jgi:hypothetical protein
MRHVSLEFRPLTAALAQLPFKSLCGLQMRDMGVGDSCPICLKEAAIKSAAPSFDLQLDKLKHEDAHDSNKLTALQAVKQSGKMVNRDGFLSQDDYQSMLEKLDKKDHYAYRMGLVGHAIHVRTGAVNIVDRVEPEVDGLGDAGTAGSTDAWTAVPSIPRPEMNDSPMGTDVLDFGKPMRSEGALDEEEKEAEIGQNLTSLTVANLVAEQEKSLNEGISATLNQVQRYRTYAELLRVANREELADWLDSLGTSKLHLAKLMMKLQSGPRMFRMSCAEQFSPRSAIVVEQVLGELWKYEQGIVDSYLKIATQNPNFGADLLSRTASHSDSLYHCAYMATTAGDLVPGPREPNPNMAHMWNDSYSNENAFEDADMKLGDCHECNEPLTTRDVVACSLCESGKQSTVTRMACWNCMGSGRMAICACGEPSFIESEWRPIERWASWRKRADEVKRVTRFADIPVHIEYEPGDVKTYPDGNSRKYKCAYGFIPGTTGADGEPFDVFLGGYPNRKAYLVTQMKPDGSFDEEKAMLGFKDASTAEAMFRSHHPRNAESQFGGIREMGLDQFMDDYVYEPRDDAFKPKLITKNVPLEQTGPAMKVADHGPGDSDGCDSGKPVGGSHEFRNLAKSDPAVKNFVKMVLDPKVLGSIAKDKPDFPIANIKGAPPMPPGISTLGDIVKAMAETEPPKQKQPKSQVVNKAISSGNKSADALTDAMSGDPKEAAKAFESLKSDPTVGAVAGQIHAMLSNPEMAGKMAGMMKDLVSGSPVAGRYGWTSVLPAQTKVPSKVETPKKSPSSNQQSPGFTNPKEPNRSNQPSVDFSPVQSPAEQAWKKEAGKLKELWDQMWKLLGGPGMKGAFLINADMPGGQSTPSSIPQYDEPVNGPFPDTDGDQDELMGIHAQFEMSMMEIVY